MLEREDNVPTFSSLSLHKGALEEGLFHELLFHVSQVESGDVCCGWWPVNQDPRCLVERVAKKLLVYAEESKREVNRFGGQARVSPVLVGAEWRLCQAAGVAEGRPYWSSFLFLTDEGGKTTASQESDCEVVAVAIKPKANQYVLFPGWARHGVLPVQPGGAIRRTLLFNWWCWRPPGLPDEPVFLPGETHG